MRQPAPTIQKVCKHHGLTAYYVAHRRCVICTKAAGKRSHEKTRAKRLAERERLFTEFPRRKFKAPASTPGICVECKGPKSLDAEGRHCAACAKQASIGKLKQVGEDLKWHVTWKRIAKAVEKRNAQNHS